MNLLSYLRRGTTDVTTNTLMRDVIGSKVDAAAAVGTTKSLMAYAKQALLQGRRCIEKSDGAVLNATIDPLFTITGGPILAQIFGIVTTVLVGAANGTLQITTTAPAATIDLSTTVAIDNDAAGTSYSFTGVAAGTVPALYPVTGGGRWFIPSTAVYDLAEFLLPIGSVGFLGSAAATGVIKWYMTYLPLSPSSVVVAAA